MEEDEGVYTGYGLENGGFLPSRRLDEFCIHIDFDDFHISNSHRMGLKREAFGGQKPING